MEPETCGWMLPQKLASDAKKAPLPRPSRTRFHISVDHHSSDSAALYQRCVNVETSPLSVAVFDSRSHITEPGRKRESAPGGPDS